MEEPSPAKSSSVVEVTEVDVTTLEDDVESVDIPGVARDALEDDIRLSQKLDTVSILHNLRLISNDLSRMRIPLCRMLPMPMVRPMLACNLTVLENQFSGGYEEGARVFYVSMCDEEGQSGVFSEAEKEAWGPLWNLVNDDFNNVLKSQPVLKHLVDHKFYV